MRSYKSCALLYKKKNKKSNMTFTEKKGNAHDFCCKEKKNATYITFTVKKN